VPVRTPAALRPINLHVAGDGWVPLELDDGPAEIGTRFPIPKSGMQHLKGPSVGEVKGVAPEALVSPNLLQPSFGNRSR
jgi:hypothetical protein